MSKDDNIPTGGFWKYYQREYDSWRLEKALFDKFPELLEDYDEESRKSVSKIIQETYEFYPLRAITYLDWLWDFFPIKEVMKHSRYDGEKLCLDTVEELLAYNTICLGDKKFDQKLRHSKHLYNFLKTDRAFNMFFKESKWKNHDTRPLGNYMEFFVLYGDFENAQKAYEAYKKFQFGKYKNRDLYEFWDRYFVLYCEHSEFCSQAHYEFIEKEIDTLGIFSAKLHEQLENYLYKFLPKKAKSHLKRTSGDWFDDEDDDEDDEDDFDIDDDDNEDENGEDEDVTNNSSKIDNSNDSDDEKDKKDKDENDKGDGKANFDKDPYWF